MHAPYFFPNHLKTLDLFAELAKIYAERSVLITGGSGFIGKWLLEALIACGQLTNRPPRITVVCRCPVKISKAFPHLVRNVTLVDSDIREFSSKKSFDFIVHAANDTGPSVHAFPLEAMSVITEGTRRILEFAAETPKLNGILLLSSGAIYGMSSQNINSFSEDMASSVVSTECDAGYAQAKRFAETQAAIAWERLKVPVKIARAFSFAGEYLPLADQRAFGNFVREALLENRIAMKGDGQAIRSYLYGGDMALWLLTILANGIPMRPYNVGSANAMSLRSLAESIAAELAPAAEISIPLQSINTTNSRYIPDIQRAKIELGLDEWTDLRTTICRTGTYAIQNKKTTSK